MSVADEVRRYWDEDSEVYDDVPNHHPTDPAERAAWAGALAGALPAAPARVLDCGAGTGFLTVMAARMGHQVTALDLSPGMLSRLKAKASAEGLDVQVVEGPAEEPPPGPFDAVIERHLLWTLPDPGGALRAWRAVAPAGRLVLFEGAWGSADPLAVWRRRARALAGYVEARRPASADGAPSPATAGGHHAEYPASLRQAMPLGSGTSPAELVRLASDAGWGVPRLHRLRDVEWASGLGRPWLRRLASAAPRFVVVAGS